MLNEKETIIFDCDMVLLDVIKSENNCNADFHDMALDNLRKFCCKEAKDAIYLDKIKIAEYGKVSGEEIPENILKSYQSCFDNFFRTITYENAGPILHFKDMKEVMRKLSEDFNLIIITKSLSKEVVESKIKFLNTYYSDLITTTIHQLPLLNGEKSSKNIVKNVVAIIDDSPHELNNFEDNVIKISPNTDWVEQTKNIISNVNIYTNPSEILSYIKG